MFAAHGAVLALTTGAPDEGWTRLGVDDLFNVTVSYGWANHTTATNQRTLVTSSPGNDRSGGLHSSYIGGKSPSTLRLQVPQTVTQGVVTLITGSADTGRQAATTAVRVQGCLGTPQSTLTLPGSYDYSGFYRHIAFRFGPLNWFKSA